MDDSMKEDEDGIATDWRDEIRVYIVYRTMPSDRSAAWRLRGKSAYYTLLEGNLFRWTASGILLRCIYGYETTRVLGAGGNHSGGQALALIIKKHGYCLQTMTSDFAKHATQCEKYQQHGPMIQIPTELLKTATTPYSFIRWAMDIIGPLPHLVKKDLC